MGKARGRGGGKPRNPRPKRAGDPDSSSEEETSFKPTQRGLGRQGNNVGMLPSSDESSEGEEEVKEGGQPGQNALPAAVAPPAAVVPVVAAPAPKPKPPPRPAAKDDDSSSEEDDSSDEDSSEDDAPAASARPLPSRPAAPAAPTQHYLSQPAAPKATAVAVDRDPEEIRQEVERLNLIRKKRDADKVQRIKMDGWDRYLPVGDGNRPPGPGKRE